MQLPAVWQAINLISGDVAGFPLDLRQKAPSISENASRIAETNPIHYAVHYQPNEVHSAFEFWRLLMVHVLLHNNAYAYISQGPTGRVQLWPLIPSATYPYQPNESQPFQDVRYYSTVNGKGAVFFQSELLHITGIQYDGVGTPDFLKLARDNLGLGLAAQDYASQFYASGGRQGGVLKIPHVEKTTQQNIEAEFRQMYENPKNAFRTFISREGVEFEPGQFSARDGQMAEAMQANKSDVASWFNIPPQMLGIPGAYSYASLEAQNRAYLQHTLQPWLDTITSECWLKLLGRNQRLSRQWFFKHNVERLIETDAKTRTEIASAEISMRTLTPNEYRDKMGRPPLEGGDEFVLAPGTPMPGDTNNNQEETEPAEDTDSADESRTNGKYDKETLWQTR